jgi:hypothetical protein
MRILCISVVIFGLVVSSVSPTLAVTMRYAVVIGNNKGTNTLGEQPFPSLRHAEAEAKILRDQLVRFANFDPTPARTILLLGATRAQVLDAVRALAAQKEKDLAEMGRAETLFLFYFTGHGLRGQLMLEDDPLTTQDLAGIFHTIRTDFTIGVFDACFSGSLDAVALADKGIESMPGLNLFRELPDEVLNAEGSVWFVSSGPDQPSYEDEKLGGVFTHFFINALEKAEREGPGIPLDRIWSYSQSNTVEYTSSRNRRQTPQQFIAKLKASGPLFFSFPMERNATLVLSESVQGQFILTYADGQLTERINKPAGQRREVAVYPGQARLMMLKDGKVVGQQELELQPKNILVLRSGPDPDPTENLGQRNFKLWEKGFGDQTLVATTSLPASRWLIGAGYEFILLPSGLTALRHGVSLAARFDHSHLMAGVRLGYGRGQETFETWRYHVDALSLGLNAGYGLDFGPTRLSFGGVFNLAYLWQNFEDGKGRNAWLFQPGVMVRMLYPTSGSFTAELCLEGGVGVVPGAGANAKYLWDGWGGVGLYIFYKFL